MERDGTFYSDLPQLSAEARKLIGLLDEPVDLRPLFTRQSEEQPVIKLAALKWKMPIVRVYESRQLRAARNA